MFPLTLKSHCSPHNYNGFSPRPDFITYVPFIYCIFSIYYCSTNLLFPIIIVLLILIHIIVFQRCSHSISSIPYFMSLERVLSRFDIVLLVCLHASLLHAEAATHSNSPASVFKVGVKGLYIGLFIVPPPLVVMVYKIALGSSCPLCPSYHLPRSPQL